MDAELESKKARLEDSSSMKDNDALDDHFERANMARFMIARQTIQRATVPDEYLIDESTVFEEPFNNIEPTRKNSDIVEVFVSKNSPEPVDSFEDGGFDTSEDEMPVKDIITMPTFDTPKTELKPVHLGTVGSSKSSVQNSKFYDISPISKLRPVSSSSESDDFEVEQSSVDTEDFFGGDIKIDQFDKAPKRYFFLNSKDLSIT